MLKPFTAKIAAALSDRINEVEEQVLNADRQYQSLMTKINEILDRIGQSLPPDQEQLLLELDEFWVEQEVLAFQRIYRQGLRDGMVMDRVLRMVRRSYRE